MRQKKKKNSTKLQRQVSPTVCLSVCLSERVNKSEATCESLRPDQKPAERKLLRRQIKPRAT